MLKLSSRGLFVFFILISYELWAQPKVENSPNCIVVEDTGGNVEIEKNTHHNYYSPTIHLEISKEELEDMLLQEDLMSKQEKENSDKAFELLLKEQNLKSKSMDFTKWLDFYKKELLVLKQKIELLRVKSPDLYAWASDMLITYEKILDSSHCLYEDLELVAFKDLYGFESVGFEKSQIENLGYYFFVDEYSESMARVKRLNKYGFIDKNGQEVIPLKFDHAEPFSGGYALVNNGEFYYYIDKQGNYKMKRIYGGTSFSKGRVFVRMDNSMWWDLLNENFKKVRIKKNESQLSSGVVRFGQLVAQEVFPFDTEGLALFRDNFGKWGFINTLGEVKALEFEYLSEFDENGFAIAKKKDRHGLVDRDFTFILNGEFEQILPGGEGMYLVSKKGNWAIISQEGDPLTNYLYASIDTQYKYNFILATRAGKNVVLNHNGLEIIPPIFYSVKRIGYNAFEVKHDNGTFEFSFDKLGNCTSENRKVYYQLITQKPKRVKSKEEIEKENRKIRKRNKEINKRNREKKRKKQWEELFKNKNN